METKRGQFFIIAAVIIVFIVIGLAAVTNYVYVKKAPQKFYDINQVLQMEGLKVIEHAEFNQENVNSNIDGYLNAFKDYMDKNTNENFNLIIVYGNAETGNVTARLFSRESLGGVSISLGGQPLSVKTGNTVGLHNVTITMNVPLEGERRTATVIIEGENQNIVQTLPVLEDNNFVFVLSTSSGFNQYVQTSLQLAPPQP